jgi:hypothetical protein
MRAFNRFLTRESLLAGIARLLFVALQLAVSRPLSTRVVGIVDALPVPAVPRIVMRPSSTPGHSD